MIRQQIKRYLFFATAWTLAFCAMGQRVAVKTNTLYWCGGVANIGMDLRISRHFTLGLDVAGTKYTVSKISNRIAAVMPEARYWFDARPQSGHALGAMMLVTNYRTKWNETGHKGDAVGVGPTYSYSLVLGKRWSMEASAGVGLLFAHDSKFTDNNTADAPAKHVTLAPLKLGLSFVYIIK